MTREELSGIGTVEIFQLNPENPLEGKADVTVFGGFDGLPKSEGGPLIRMHSSCLYGEVLQSLDCDCGPQLDTARQRILDEGGGILFYLYQEGRGAGLLTKASGYAISESEGVDTMEAYRKMGVPFDQRHYGHCARFLLANGITNVRLMSNNPRKIGALEKSGITVTRSPLIVGVNDHNIEYLRTKRDKGEHLFPKDL